MRTLAAACLLLAACETPPLTIKFRLTGGDSQQCITETDGNQTTDCSDITLICDAVVSIRIVPPNDQKVPYVSVCEPMSLSTSQRQLCALARTELPAPAAPIPEQVLEVQLAVFERSVIGTDAEGKLVCPIVQFGVNGLPVTDVDCASADTATCQARPAIGGRAFYHPGDTETLIELGCTELEQLRGEKCSNPNRTTVTATVNEFEFPAGIDVLTANRLAIGIGEPVPTSATSYGLDISRTHSLTRVEPAQPPFTWAQDLNDLDFTKSYCIEVDEDVAMATKTLTCRRLPPTYPEKIEALGTRLKTETLTTVLKAAGLTAFPSTGLVVGIVLSPSLLPVSGVKVTANCPADMASCGATVQYLSEDRLSLTTDGTHSSGIFVSRDAPYGSNFTRQGQFVSEVFGGLVENKVTIVVMQEPTPTGM